MASMTACARCQAETAPAEMFFTTSGEQVCRRCNAAAQNAVADARARESLEQSTPEGMRATSFGTPVGTIVAGAVVMALGLFWLLAGYYLGGRIFFFPFLLLGSGFLALARGLKLRRQ